MSEYDGMAGSTEPSGPVRVVLADDQDLVRTGFGVILGAEDGIEVVAEARDGLEAIRAVEQTAPDVVLMDVQMPGLDGLEATRRILRADASDAADAPDAADARDAAEAADPTDGAGAVANPVKVIILTTFDREDYLFEALRAGASGFLLKNASPEDLVESIRVVHRGDALLAPEVTRRVIERFSAGAPAAVPSRPEGLTDREFEVLSALATGATNTEIAAQLFLGEATVKTHVSRVLMKLDLRDRTQAVVYAYEHGIVAPGAGRGD